MISQIDRAVIDASHVAYERYTILEKTMPRSNAANIANSTKWRLAHINASVPDADFLTIQFEDYSVLPYRSDWKKVYSHLFDAESEWEDSSTGNKWGKWHYGLTDLIDSVRETS